MSANEQQGITRGRQSRGKRTLGLRVLVPAVRNLSRIVFKERFEGRELIPVTGPAILVLNHISVADPIATASFVYTAGRIPRFLIKDSVFKVPVVGALMSSARQIPVSRGSGAAQASLDSASDALRAGDVIAVYPEGTVTREPTYWPMKAKTGIGRLVLQNPDVPVIPVVQWGAHLAWDYHTKKMHLFPRKITRIRALPPMDLTAFRDRTDRNASRELTDHIMLSLQKDVAVLRGEPAPTTLYDAAKAAAQQRRAQAADETP